MKFRLASSDIHSPTWAKLSRHIDARLQELRVQNDSLILDPIQTAAVRGRIAELKQLLQSADESPPPLEPSDGM